MHTHQISSIEQSHNKLGRTLLGLLLGIIGTLGVYAFYNLNWGIPLFSSHYDTGSNSGEIPSVGDYLFGSGGTGGIISGAFITGSQLTGTTGLIYPTGYLEQYKKALLVLQNDKLINTYIDTEKLISSGFNDIQIATPSDTNKPKFSLLAKVADTIEKVFIIGINNNGAYYFEPINSSNGSISYDIDASKGNIKPGQNTYYMLGKNINNEYSFQYIQILTSQGKDFYSLVDKICIVDICSDPNLSKQFVTGSQTILQQSTDGKTVIQIIPDESITVAYKDSSAPQPSIRKIKKIGDYYQKTLVSGAEPSITQKIIDKDGNNISLSTLGLGLPNKLAFGNIKYNNPNINFEDSSNNFIKVAKIDAGFIIEDIKKSLFLPNTYNFQLPNGVYLTYSLDTSSLKVVNPSNVDGTYKIIPKVAERMKNPIVYTVPSSDIGMHDKVSSYFKGSIIEKTGNCSNNKPNPDPNAKFGLYPIDGQYDVVGLRNCYGIK